VRTAALLLGGLALLPTGVEANAWTKRKGEAQAILKLERMRAERGFDPDGELQTLAVPREDVSLGVLVEYGVTDSLTVQVKGDWQSGEDQFVDYRGRGPLEIGVTWQAYRDDWTAASLYLGYADGGEGRNAGYAQPGQGERDVEVRGAVGRSIASPPLGRWGPDRAFVELQGARRLRDGLPDEVRADVTIGGHYGERWLVLAQAFGGAADDGGARWLSVETSVVRNLGRWSLQAGWRQTVAGRETPRAEGPVVALWRRF
jgi:protein XagA